MKPTSPPQPIRMIALDLDGTLLRADKSIGPRTRDALHAARKKGVEIVLASGRMTPAMEETAQKLGLDCCIVSYNGGAVCGRMEHGRKRLFHGPLGSDVARDLYAYARKHRYQVNFYHEDVVVSEDAAHLRPWAELYRERTNSPFRFVKSLEAFLHHAPTKLLFILEPKLRGGVEQELSPSFGSRATIVRTDPEYLEFLNPTVDKGSSVLRLAEMLSIAPAQIMAMGDGDNDVTMLQSAGWGVAVANAGAGCRAVAAAMTQNDHEHDAVGEAVERWVL